MGFFFTDRNVVAYTAVWSRSHFICRSHLTTVALAECHWLKILWIYIPILKLTIIQRKSASLHRLNKMHWVANIWMADSLFVFAMKWTLYLSGGSWAYIADGIEIQVHIRRGCLWYTPSVCKKTHYFSKVVLKVDLDVRPALLALAHKVWKLYWEQVDDMAAPTEITSPIKAMSTRRQVKGPPAEDPAPPARRGSLQKRRI